VQLGERAALDIALFYNDYDHVRTIEVGTPFLENDPAPPHMTVPVPLVTTGKAKTWGVEAGADFNVRPWWMIRASYSFIDIKSDNVFDSTGAEEVPHNIFSLQNRFDLPHNVEFDTTLRYVDDIKNLNIGDYAEIDARLSWKPRKDLELSLEGRNLLDSEHEEYDDVITLGVPTQVQRSVYGKVTWRF